MEKMYVVQRSWNGWTDICICSADQLQDAITEGYFVEFCGSLQACQFHIQWDMAS